MARAQGRKLESLSVEVLGEITPQDLAEVETEREEPQQKLHQLRDSHHRAAQCVADGFRDSDICSIVGYTPSYLSSLKRDPAFSHLVEHYKEQNAGILVDVKERLAGLSLDALNLIQERMNLEGDTISLKDLKDLAALGLDRTGFGPQSTLQTQNVHLTGEDLAEIKKKAQERQGPQSGAGADHSGDHLQVSFSDTVSIKGS